jgi:hypothetical protein
MMVCFQMDGKCMCCVQVDTMRLHGFGVLQCARRLLVRKNVRASVRLQVRLDVPRVCESVCLSSCLLVLIPNCMYFLLLVHMCVCLRK